VLLATVSFGLWLFGSRYFALEVHPPAHCRASAHFFSEISRLRFANYRGIGARFSTPREPGSSAPTFAHLSASSLPAMPL